MRHVKLLSLVVGGLLATACGRAAKAPASLSVSARGTPGGTVVGGALQVSPDLSVSRVRLLVKDIELEAVDAPPGTGMPPGTVPPGMGDRLVPADQGGGDDGEGDDGEHEDEVAVGPFLIDLSGGHLTGTVTTAFDGQIPAGTYHELRLRVAPIPASDAGGDTGLLDMAQLEASVAIDGMAGTGETATPFSVALPLRAVVKKEGTVQVGPGTTNVTVAVDPAAWFAGVSDPTSDAGKAKLAENILSSLGVFLDDDEDGNAD